MKITEALQGQRIPQCIAIIFWVCSLVVVLGTFYALHFSRFMPSPLGIKWALGMGTICGIGGAILGFRILPHSRHYFHTSWLLASVFALVFFGCGYEAFAAGIPSWYTNVFGSYGLQIVKVSDWHPSSRWRCAGPNINGAPMIFTLCMDYREAAKAPTGALLILKGPASAFGINVEYLYRRD